MSKFDIAKAREICEKATSGPWIKATEPEYDADYETADRLVGGPTGRDIYDREIGISICSPQSEADADFIAGARDLLPAALDEIERLIHLVDETVVQLSACRSVAKQIQNGQAKRIADLEKENRNLVRHYLTDDARDRFIAKQHAALKKLGKAKRERGKALVEERTWHFVVGGADECIVPDEESSGDDCYCVDEPKDCPAFDYLTKVARDQLRREGLL